ncbi:hypothetical protein C8Q76DRAFT_15303 [Earliella scabrosa]|nr:hypothetical protein C8Q76DRAFT_15303 [Earliella scabrosa]
MEAHQLIAFGHPSFSHLVPPFSLSPSSPSSMNPAKALGCTSRSLSQPAICPRPSHLGWEAAMACPNDQMLICLMRLHIKFNFDCECAPVGSLAITRVFIEHSTQTEANSKPTAQDGQVGRRYRVLSSASPGLLLRTTYIRARQVYLAAYAAQKFGVMTTALPSQPHKRSRQRDDPLTPSVAQHPVQLHRPYHLTHSLSSFVTIRRRSCTGHCSQHISPDHDHARSNA